MRLVGIASVLSLILASAPAGAAAQSHGAPSDPKADSPSGVVYELPLDKARKDAAPRRGGNGSSGRRSGGSAGQGSSGDPARGDTSIRSENNFGSSSQVPGVSGEDSGGAGSDDADSGASGGPGGSGGNGSGGSRSGGDDLAKSRAEELASRATGNPIAAGGPSNSVVVPLVIALLAVGAAIGIVAGRRSRTLRRRDI